MKTIAVIAAVTLLLAGCNARKVQGGGKPPAAGATQKVHLVWQAGAWKVSLNGGNPQSPNTAKITLTKDTGPTEFVMDIQGSTTVSFKDPGGLDVWEGVNAKSQPQTGINSTQVLGPTFSKNGKQLTFWDLNEGDPVTLNYRLNFDSGPSVDPIIDNGGGNWQ
jgi:hypothetical protein